MVAGDSNRCSGLLLVPKKEATNLCCDDESNAGIATNIDQPSLKLANMAQHYPMMSSSYSMKHKLSPLNRLNNATTNNKQQVNYDNNNQHKNSLDKTNELLKLTNLKLNDDDDDDYNNDDNFYVNNLSIDTEKTTTNTNKEECCKQETTIIELEAKAQPKLDTLVSVSRNNNTINQKTGSFVEASCIQKRMLVATQHSSPSSSSSSPTNTEQHPADLQNRMQQQVNSTSTSANASSDLRGEQQQLVESYYSNQSQEFSRALNQQQQQYQEHHFAPYSSTLDLDTNYHAHYHGDYLNIQGNQQQVTNHLEFLELEPSNERLVQQQQQQQSASQSIGNKLYQVSSSFNPADTLNYDSNNQNHQTNYLTSLDPSPHCNTFDCDLPDSVIRLNYQQEQQQQQQVAAQFSSSNSQQFVVNNTTNQVSTIQFGGEQHQYNYTTTTAADSSNLQQDSGHVSCVDSSGSLVLNGLNNSNQHMQQSNRQLQHNDHQSTLSHHHHHQQQQHQQHLLIQQQEPELKVCEWEGCEHTFLDMQEFVKHLEDKHVNQEPKEKNRYFCLWSNCKRNEQEFNARYKLLIHMRVHSGEKPYPCNNTNCRKSFSRLENLKIHQRSHTGEKPYKCIFDGCSKSFTNSSDRIKHHKTHKDPKPYSCNYNGCTKRYTDPSSLRKHLRAHKRAQMPTANVVTLQNNNNNNNSNLLDNNTDNRVIQNFHQVESTSGCVGVRGGNQQLLSSGLSCCNSANYEHNLVHFEPANNVNNFTQQHNNSTCSTRDYSSSSLSQFKLDEMSNVTTVDHNNLSPLNSNHHLNLNLNHHYQNNSFNYQHNQLSRSWCAGSAPRLSSSSNSTRSIVQEQFCPTVTTSQQQPLIDTFQPTSSFSSIQNLNNSHNFSHQQQYQSQQQQHFHTNTNQRSSQLQHETLMRSLPLGGGFRIPYSRLSNAHTEWPPPSASASATLEAAGVQQLEVELDNNSNYS